MTDTNKLQQIIDDGAVSITWLADQVGCSRKRIYSILKGEGGECTVREVAALTAALHLTSEQRDAIFFSPLVNQ